MRPDEMIAVLSTKVAIQQNEKGHVTNRLQLVRHAEILGAVPSLQRAAQLLIDHLASESFAEGSTDGDLLVPKNQTALERLTTAVHELMSRRGHVLAFLREVYPDDPEETFFVRLPDAALETPDVFQRYVDDLAGSVVTVHPGSFSAVCNHTGAGIDGRARS